MNMRETSQLLTKASLVDNRKLTNETTMAWQEILAGVEYADAMAALTHHRATSTDYLQPAHIVAGARRIRAERLDRISAAAIPPPAEIGDDAAGMRAWLRQQVQSIANGFSIGRALAPPPGQRRQGPPPRDFEQAREQLPGDHSTRRLALSVTCPWCRALPGKPCTLGGTKDPIQGRPAHEARVEAARSQQ